MSVLRACVLVSFVAVIGCGDPAASGSGDVLSTSAPSSAGAETVERPAIAEKQGVWPHLRVELLEVERVADGLLNVRFAFVNTSTEARIEFGTNFAAEERDFDSVAGVFLTDSTDTRRYFVVRDPQGYAHCSTGVEGIPPGGRRELWVQFPAPPPEETTVSVHIPNVPVFRSVPIAGTVPADDVEAAEQPDGRQARNLLPPGFVSLAMAAGRDVLTSHPGASLAGSRGWH